MSETTETTTALEPKPEVRRSNIAVGTKGLMLTGLDELWRFAGFVEKTPGFAPKGMDSQASITVAIQFGLELGLSPMQALQSLAVINGRPSIFGDAGKALVESSGLMEEYKQWYEIDGKKLLTSDGYPRTPTAAEMKNESLMACVFSKRKGREEPLVHTFSIGDAKIAGLLGKQGPWTNYPSRMLMWRARGFNLRDNFGDVLKGLYFSEEAEDLPPVGLNGDTTKVKSASSVVDGLRDRIATADAESTVIDKPAETKPAPTDTKLAEGEIDPLTAALDDFKAAGGVIDEFAESNGTTPAKIRASKGKEREMFVKLLEAETKLAADAEANAGGTGEGKLFDNNKSGAAK